MTGELSIWHWLVVAVVVMLLFGYKKLPDAARSIGRSLRVFKAEMRGMQDDSADTTPARPPSIEGRAEGPGDAAGGGSTGAQPAEERLDRARDPD
jgi:sec-independent protein translocase protein TatA